MTHHRVPVTGGCLCRAVRYEHPAAHRRFLLPLHDMPEELRRALQRDLEFSGSAFAFTKGEQKYYRATSIAKRGFCAACGSLCCLLL